MKTLNKILVTVLALCMLLSLCILTSCGDDGDTTESSTVCSEHKDSDNNGKCDICSADVKKNPCTTHIDDDYDKLCDECGESLIPVIVKYPVTVSLKKEDGTGLANAKIMLKSQDDSTVVTMTTDANGIASCELVKGEYLVMIEDLPQNWYSTSNYSTVVIAENDNIFDFEVIDNTPDGTVEKPFPSQNAETGVNTTVTIPAYATYNFTTKGASRYLIINNAGAKVTYKDVEYTADGDGIVKVLFDATESTEITLYQITNTSSAEITVEITFESVPGTQDNPFTAELESEIVAPTGNGTEVYYTVTATKDGTLVAYSSNPLNSIMMYNTTSYTVSNHTNGSPCGYIAVKSGDKISITVGLVTEEEPCDIAFTLSICQGNVENPIPVYGDLTMGVLAGEELFIKYLGEASTLCIDCFGIDIYLNGDKITGDDGSFLFDVSTNDMVKIVNNNSQRIELEILFLSAVPYKK